MKLRHLVSLAAIPWTLALPAFATTTIIDDFETGDFALVDTGALAGPTSAEQSLLPTSSVIGGVRWESARVTGTQVDLATATLVTTPGDDSLVLATTNSFRSRYDLVYDGVPDGAPNLIPSGILGADFSGSSGIQLSLTTTGTNATVQVYLYETFNPAMPTAHTNISQKTQVVSGNMFFDFAIFPNLDPSDIQTIRFLFEEVTNEDLISIRNIAATIPEPGTALLLVSGLVGLAVRRRARR